METNSKTHLMTRAHKIVLALVVVVLGAALIFGLTGCGGSGEEFVAEKAEEPAVTTAAPVTLPPITIPEVDNYEILISNFPRFSLVGKELVDDLASINCTGLWGGVSFVEVAMINLEAASTTMFTPEEAGGVLAYSVHEVCPEFTVELEAFVETFS